jgi:FemAB-related protein (PEP-CTERM system-associated)
MPFLNYGGPLGSEEAVRAMAREAVRRAELEGVKLLELRSRTALPLDLAVSHRKLTVLVDVAGGPVALWESLSTNIRNKVRRPQKAGVTVRFGAGEMGPFYKVFARHMRDLGTPTQSERFFQTIQETFPDSVVFGCAYYRGLAIAGGCGFRWGDEFEITWSSALREHSDVRANYLLQWAFMERAANEGCRTFNFGRSTPGGGTHQFKRQWGGRDELLWWYQLSRGTASTPSPDQNAYRWGTRLWRRLPVPLATFLGPRIVSYIP